MTSIGTSLVKYRLSRTIKIKSTLQQKHIILRHRHRINLLEFLRKNNHQYILANNSTMSKAFIDELDHKMQQVREYALIAHGYRNENMQYPVHVRRSHDGEKLSRTPSQLSKSNRDHRKNPPPTTTILAPSSHENLTKIKQDETVTRHLSYDERHAVSVAPPNKTINDIDPSLNHDKLHKNKKSSLPPNDASTVYCSSRPHSIAAISLSSTYDQQVNSLLNSTQTLISQPTPTKTLTQRLFSKFFNAPSKS
ncbi:unnamed protein product [Rotaria socialis]|uniref:Uncharacterized protein n=1 Tax=Rotaria socialis TaxID=392032 RepID=A0A817R1Z1_9BILA|nr:unnamed protein product [Rotaria socialis]CAF3396296.1 unnamed protein product [Rotaria socialis]CAF3427972.1 unnamed protein product [Rotaria socialis]CAF3546229.1 unnamed protein product [Rotaria socialis]CAF3753019.1 unnamed protein product [Rotaria socialis]